MSSNPTLKMLSRKPSKWALTLDDRVATVEQTGATERGKRWRLIDDGAPGGFFPSRRAAVYFFETGKRFKTNPVFAVIGGRRSQKRVR